MYTHAFVCTLQPHATLQISETKMDISVTLDFGNISAAGQKGELVIVLLIDNCSIMCSRD